MHTFIKNTAQNLGFDACGISPADELTGDKVYMKNWLKVGLNGDMQYLERNFDKRFDPRLLVPGCKSVIVTLTNYYTSENQPENAPKVAKYGWPEVDYHFVIKAKLSQLEQAIRNEFGNDCFNDDCQHLFVDSAPFAEKSFAQRAGLGWVGKNKLLISPVLGSFCFIGILLINNEMVYDEPIRDKCGNCTRCIDACPTKALQNGVLDARRCISYLTLETKREIQEDLKPYISGYVKGCDICANVCPWNKKLSKQHDQIELKPVKEILEFTKEDWLQLSQTEFNRIFGKSAIKRGGFERLKEMIGLPLNPQNGE